MRDRSYCDQRPVARRCDIPTVAEQLPGFQALEGTGAWVLGPAGIQAPVVNRLHQAVVYAVKSPDVAETFIVGGQIPSGKAPAALAADMKAVIERAGKLVKYAGIQPE
jgi:tripartite-type tricarboxylate transporter receptor subunit TctC